MKKKRLPRAGERVKVGRRVLTVPGVEPEKPTDDLSEELTRTVKAAYQ